MTVRYPEDAKCALSTSEEKGTWFLCPYDCGTAVPALVCLVQDLFYVKGNKSHSCKSLLFGVILLYANKPNVESYRIHNPSINSSSYFAKEFTKDLKK